ncbi:MAG TPA: sulfite exporter TauE/SafE family protein [Acidobacteriaceae bacterium]|nr:sulfite exporter TauE/SafE family protein [Acidobacteriaceae bacterium]
MTGTEVYVLLVVFAATLLRSTFGFGEALFAVPLLALRIPVAVAAPLAVLVSITIAAVVIAQDYRSVHLRSAGWLLGATLFGVPLGLLLLADGQERFLKRALAFVILAFALYFLSGQRPSAIKSESRAWLFACGFLAGVFGGAFGMNGPPLVVYGAMRRWTPQQFRATLQGYFLPASTVGMAGYAATGMWTSAVTHFYVLSLAGVILATLLGRWLNRRLQGDVFMRYVYGGLAIVGAVLLAQSFRIPAHFFCCAAR